MIRVDSDQLFSRGRNQDRDGPFQMDFLLRFFRWLSDYTRLINIVNRLLMLI